MDDMSLTEALDLADLTSPMPTLAGRALKRLRAHLEMLREVDVDRKRLLHALDVALNGEDGAAPAPGLADLLAQVQQAVRTRGAPLLVDRRQPALDEAAKRIRNALLADGRNEQVALFDQLLTEHQRAAQGDAVDVAVTAWNESAFTGGAALRDRLAEVVRAVLHAERARVPEGWALVPIKPTQQMLDAMGACEYPLNAWDEALAAAPSQPKDAGEVGHG